jgi:AraC-like DNA-binding protein
LTPFTANRPAALDGMPLAISLPSTRARLQPNQESIALNTLHDPCVAPLSDGRVDLHPPLPRRQIDHWVRCVTDYNTPALEALPTALHRALQYMGRHYDESISAEQLAEKSCVSVSHLRFLFRDSLGISFKLFLQRIRIAHAMRLLLELPPKPITVVALDVGFNDFSHFQKCFRQIMGQPPGALRRGRKLTID